MARRTPVLVAALAALLAAPAGAQAASPWPCLWGDSQLLVPKEGVPHEFDASCTVDPDGHELVHFEWDLDGDGAFETSTGGSPALVHTFTDRGNLLDAGVAFAIRVTDAAGESGTFDLPLKVTDRINSWFLFGPQLVNPGDRVSLAATTAHVDADADYQPQLTYAWDLDGDGAFETSTGGDPAASYVAPQTLGKLPIRLRVSDELGNVSTVKRQVEVLPRHPSRDMVPWNAPENLLDVPVTQVQATGLQEATVVAPVGPDMPTVEPDGKAAEPRRPTLRRISANRDGLSLRYTGGPKWSRWNVVVRLPAARAASYGLPRRTIVLARGKIVFGADGVGKATRMRWTKGAYGIFRRVQRGVVDIVARRVA
jgi:hypothetical protein